MSNLFTANKKKSSETSTETTRTEYWLNFGILHECEDGVVRQVRPFLTEKGYTAGGIPLDNLKPNVKASEEIKGLNLTYFEAIEELKASLAPGESKQLGDMPLFITRASEESDVIDYEVADSKRESIRMKLGLA